MSPTKINTEKEFLHFVDKVKESRTRDEDEKTILELNIIVSPFYNDFIKPTIERLNEMLIEKFGINSPQFKVVSNIDFKNQIEQNRNFIHIVFQEKPGEFNLISSPFFLIDIDISGNCRFIASDFKEAKELDNIDNFYKTSLENLKSKFYSSFAIFFENLFNGTD